MTVRVGINGFGRIGRVIFRLAQERKDIEIVAINDLLNADYMAYILKYDSTHGKFKGSVSVKNQNLVVNEKIIRCTSDKNPANLKWNDIGVKIVAEATGIFLTEEDAYKHITAGAEKVIMTGPPKDNIPMFVMGVNHISYSGQNIVSNASCTTNCVAPLAKVINDNFGIIDSLMTTVHAVTATQKIIDGISLKDWRIGRSAIQNIIPSSTGAAKAVGKIIPELHNKITGISFRVPVSNVSVIDLTVRLKKSSSYENICSVIKNASENEMKNIMGYIDEEMVSSDFNGESLTSVFDVKSSIALNKNFVK